MTLLVRSTQGCATSPNVSPHVKKSKTVLHSGFHGVDSGFQVVNPNSQWNSLNSRFQSLVGFRIPKPRIPDSTRKIFPDSGIRIPLHGAKRHSRGTKPPC